MSDVFQCGRNSRDTFNQLYTDILTFIKPLPDERMVHKFIGIMKGILNFYFPCKLKNSSALKKLDRRWRRVRTYQTREIVRSRRALTDLIFLQRYREQNEALLAEYQKRLGGMPTTSPPFAEEELQRAYQELYDDYIFSKNISSKLREFSFYDTNLTYHLGKETKLNGIVLLNVNAENRVATFIVAIAFDDLGIDQCIYLKHLFYKHCLVKIEGCEEETTFVDYVASCNPFKNSEIEEQIDFRCRYSYLEVDVSPNIIKHDRKKIIMGLLRADEGFRLYPGNPEDKEKRAYFKIPANRIHYQIYYYGYDVLLLVSGKESAYPFKYEAIDGNIDVNKNKNKHKHIIAGTSIHGEFPNYLKAVEIHYLVNNETTNEIEPKERSYVKPWVFIKRAYRIWTIIYEVDTNKYHISKYYLDSFETSNLLLELREEYNNLLVHIVGFIASVLAFITLFFTVVSVCK